VRHLYRGARGIFFRPPTTRLKENAKSYIAWKSIVEDINDQKINLDMVHIKQAKKSSEDAQKVFNQSVKETYKWVMNPYEEFSKGKHDLMWEYATISSSLSRMLPIIESKVIEEEWVIPEWSPIHLSNVLKEWYFKDGNNDVVTRKMFNDMASYIYLPRLKNEDVLKRAIEQGVMTEDFFGYAQGKEGSKYLGLLIGSSGQIIVDETSLLIQKDIAVEEKISAHVPSSSSGNSQTDHKEVGSSQVLKMGVGDTQVGGSSADSAKVSKKRFFASVPLQPQTAKLDFNNIMNEVLMHLTSNSSCFVDVTIEINAVNSDGFDEQMQRTLNENCNALNFRISEFSDE
jgi:hypothetical protein